MKKTMMTQEEYYNRRKLPDELDDYYRQHFDGCKDGAIVFAIVIALFLVGLILIIKFT